MFKNNIAVTQKVAVLTDTHPALPKLAEMRLRVETGNTDRASSLMGNFTVAHAITKELGGGYRHAVRNNLRQQGDIPGASAYFVSINNDTVPGENRAIEAFYGLLVGLITLDDDTELKTTEVSNDGIVTAFNRISDDTDVSWEMAINVILPRVLARLMQRES